MRIVDQLQLDEKAMVALLQKWSNINSGSFNITGLNEMCHALRSSFSVLNGKMETIALPPGKRIDAEGNLVEVPFGNALSITKRLNAPLRLFFGGHMDTVFAANSSFNRSEKIDDNTLLGPGVADMKGGLLILLKTLEALEATSYAENIGWEILINPDEEIGSTGSESLLVRAAKRNQLGFVFEPTLPNGNFVSARKGSANFALVAKGVSAHAGRDFHKGKNAIHALAQAIVEMSMLIHDGTTLNVGHIHGGGPVNIVPDLAIAKANIRIIETQHLSEIVHSMKDVCLAIKKRTGVTVELIEEVSRPPKVFDNRTRALFEQIKMCGEDLSLSLGWENSGGTSDGNTLAAAGLPTIDTLGVLGGNIHTHQEFMKISSLTERVRLLLHFLIKLSSGEIHV